jgi:hypothetical protein
VLWWRVCCNLLWLTVADTAELQQRLPLLLIVVHFWIGLSQVVDRSPGELDAGVVPQQPQMRFLQRMQQTLRS